MPEPQYERGIPVTRGGNQDGHLSVARGETLREISSAVVGLYREHFGKGPTKAKTYAHDDLVVCVLRNGLTTIEKTLYERGKGQTVREVRTAFQDAIGGDFIATIERLTDRNVTAFMSQTHMEPDLVIGGLAVDGRVGYAAHGGGGAEEDVTPIAGSP